MTRRALTSLVSALLLVLIAPAGAAATPAHQATTTPITRVVLIMEENHSYAQAMSGMPYLRSLATRYGSATNMWASYFPSLPNYIDLTSGQVPADIRGKDCTPSASCDNTTPSIFSQGSWRVWAESMPTPCDKSNSGEYVPRHTAAPYYTKIAAACKTYDTALPASPVPTAKFTLVAPNLLHDAHNGTLAAADSWLKTFVGKVMATSAYQSGGVLVEVTFDSAGGNCGQTCPSHVAGVFINPQISGVAISEKTTHGSILRLDEELLGYPLLGAARTAVDLRTTLGL